MIRVILVLFAISGCTDSIRTQSQRYALSKDDVRNMVVRNMECKDTTITIVESEKIGLEYFDFYRVVGCGQQSDLFTRVWHVDTAVAKKAIWQFGLIPSEKYYQRELKLQLAETAKFTLGCEKTEIQILNSSLDQIRKTYKATVGVHGCEKKATFQTECSHTAYSNQAHKIACANVAL